MTIDQSPAARLLDHRSWPEARAALAENPHRAKAMRVMAAASEAEGRLDDPRQAVGCYRRAVAVDPTHAPVMLRAGLARRPDDANGHLALATALFSGGNVREGFAEYEWRHTSKDTRYDLVPAPRWDGRPLPYGTLLVWGEQGVGDEMLFIPYR